MTLYRFAHESATARLRYLSEGHAELIGVWSGRRRLGHATALMGIIAEYADKREIILLLKVMARGPIGSLNNQQLERFYAKFGFEKQPEFTRPVRMIRHPRTKYTAPNEKK